MTLLILAELIILMYVVQLLRAIMQSKKKPVQKHNEARGMNNVRSPDVDVGSGRERSNRFLNYSSGSTLDGKLDGKLYGLLLRLEENSI